MKDLINDITLFMREHTDRNLSIEELADKYGYSKFHFSREFKKVIGVSPNEYWAALKMEQSLSALARSHSIINAHLKTGYQSTGTFTTSLSRNRGSKFDGETGQDGKTLRQ
jgi:methylphosphotriester-DNA--protein-cysteine methyltransferase